MLRGGESNMAGRLTVVFLAFLVVAGGGLLTVAGIFLQGRPTPAPTEAVTTTDNQSAPFRSPGGCSGCRADAACVDETQHMPDPAIAVVKDAGKVEATDVRDVPPPGAAPDGMVWIPPGKFSMGSDYQPFGDARPIHTVELDGFWMDRMPVSNEQFAAFVRATGYVTVAERKPDSKDFPGVPEEKLVPGSLVFTPPRKAVALSDHRQWWRFVPGACWNHPEGPSSDLQGCAQASRGACLLGRCHRLCEVGRQTLADRGRMGIRRPWQADANALRLGPRVPARRSIHGQHLAGPIPLRKQSRGWLGAQPLPSAVFHPTASACTTWRATSGSGVATGIVPTITREARGAIPRGPRTATIPKSRACPSACNAAAPSSAATSIARATCRAVAARERWIPAPPTSVFVVFRHLAERSSMKLKLALLFLLPSLALVLLLRIGENTYPHPELLIEPTQLVKRDVLKHCVILDTRARAGTSKATCRTLNGSIQGPGRGVRAGQGCRRMVPKDRGTGHRP